MAKETDPKKKPSRAADTVSEIPAIKVPNERTNFKKLLFSNPNFFGTFPNLGKVVKQISGDTTFEQLTCLGLYPGEFIGGSIPATARMRAAMGPPSLCDSSSKMLQDGTTLVWVPFRSTTFLDHCRSVTPSQ
jgi:hypothetical protein